jgi:hypothetical protein
MPPAVAELRGDIEGFRDGGFSDAAASREKACAITAPCGPNPKTHDRHPTNPEWSLSTRGTAGKRRLREGLSR